MLTPQEVEEFFVILRRMRDQGKTVVIITHKLSEVLAISDHVTVMRDGRVVGRREDERDDAAELARLMVGREVLLRVEKPHGEGRGRRPERPRTSPSRHVTATPRLDNVSFDVRAGEIVGDRRRRRQRPDGTDRSARRPAASRRTCRAHRRSAARTSGGSTRGSGRRSGIAHVPEDRHRRGLLLDSALSENAILGVHYRAPAVTGVGARAAEPGRQSERRTEHVIREFDVRPPNRRLAARALSGGNQQKLIIGREFELPPTLLLVSQPTRGVDIGAIEFIHRKIVALRDAGCAVLLVSAELEEVTALVRSPARAAQRPHRGRGRSGASRRTKTIGLMMTGGHVAEPRRSRRTVKHLASCSSR